MAKTRFEQIREMVNKLTPEKRALLKKSVDKEVDELKKIVRGK